MKNQILNFIATFGFSGKIKPAPGSWGTLAGIGVSLPIYAFLGPLILLLFAIFLFIIGIYASQHYGIISDMVDNGEIVIDEAAAIAFILACLPLTPAYILTAFVCFRFFDILKPWPIAFFDQHIKNGFGVMFDDMLAAFYSLIVIKLGFYGYDIFFLA